MMDNDNSLNKRPTFKMSITQHQYDQHIYHYDADLVAAFRDLGADPETVRAKKTWTLTAATMTYSLEAAVVLPMALQQLKHWQRWASKGNFQLQKYVISSKIFWHPGITPVRIQAILSAIS